MYSRRVPPLPIYMHLYMHCVRRPTDTYNTTIACVHVHASVASVREGGSYRANVHTYIHKVVLADTYARTVGAAAYC